MEQRSSKRLLVVGRIGSGKSHFVRYQTDQLREYGINFERLVLVDQYFNEYEKEGIKGNTLLLKDMVQLNTSNLSESDLVVFDHTPMEQENLVFETMLRLKKDNISSVFVTQPCEKVVKDFSRICEYIISCKYEHGEFRQYVLNKR